MSPFDALEPSLDTLRVASIRVFRGTAPLGAYQRSGAVMINDKAGEHSPYMVHPVAKEQLRLVQPGA